MKMKPRTRPISGATTMNTSVFVQPCGMMTLGMAATPDRRAARAIAAPAYAPIRACDDEVGSPHHQVSKSQTIAPNNPASTTY